MGFTLGTKFNEGTDWEFTVSQETIAEAVQVEGGITEADIADYCYVGLIDARVVAMLAESTRSSNDGLYPWAMEFCAAYNTNNGAHPSKVQMNVNQKEQNVVTCYQRNIITYYGTIGGKTGHFLVMDMANIKKWIMDFDVYPAYQAGNVTSTVGFPGYTGACYVYNEANVARVTPYQAEDSPTANLFLMNIFATEDTLWIGALNPTAHSKEKISNEKLSHAAWEFDYAAADTYNAHYTGYIYQAGPTPMQGWSNFPDAEFPDPPGNTTVFDSYLECDDSVDGIIRVSGQYGNNQNAYITNCEQGNIVKTLHGVHTVESWGGLLFKDNNVVYKPIIEGGLVTGFTSDMDIPSEWDNMTNVTGNNISPTPPTPPPSGDGDDYTDMSLGVSNVTLGGLTKYAILSKQELIDLIIDYNTNQATAGTNFSNHIICLYRLGFGASDLVVTSSDKIKMIQSAGDVDFESSANYSIVTRQTPFIHFGSITVPRHTGTFYDFSPYSNYELYIPGCGWIPLPDNVAGRTLNVYLVFDLPTCSAKGIVRIAGGVYGGTTIATVNGIIGASVPFTIGENGMQRAAILSGSVQTAAALGTAFLGVGTGNLYMGASGVAMAANGIASNYVAGNTNFISTKGGASDFSAFGDGATAVLKYNAPEIDPVVNNTMFGHTVGYLCNEVGKLSGFKGFTVCDNPHVTFSASSAEREEIERLLSSGVIL